MKGLVRSLSQLGANPNPVTHPVNISCGRKSEYPEKSHDFGQSVDQWRTLREILGGGGGGGREIFKMVYQIRWYIKFVANHCLVYQIHCLIYYCNVTIVIYYCNVTIIWYHY